MTPDELPSQPRKASWKWWIVVLAGVLAIVLAVLFLKAPAPEPVSVRCVGSTNYNGQKFFVFKGTNGSSVKIAYSSYVLCHPKRPTHAGSRWFPLPNQVTATASAGATFTFFLDAPPKDVDWCITLFFIENGHVMTPWEERRFECVAFLADHGMPRLAWRIPTAFKMRYITAADLKE